MSRKCYIKYLNICNLDVLIFWKELTHLYRDMTFCVKSVIQYNDLIQRHYFQELAEMCLRIERIIFFGTVYLCGVDPPVLKLHKSESGESEYISVVETSSPPEQVCIYCMLCYCSRKFWQMFWTCIQCVFVQWYIV